MAVAYESDGGTVFAASASNAAITVPLPGTRPTGSVLLLMAWSRLITDTVGTAPSGYTLVSGFPQASATASGGKVWLYARVATSSETAPTFACSGAVTGNSGDLWGACIFCYSGVETSGSIDAMFEGGAAIGINYFNAAGTTSCTLPANGATGGSTMAVGFLARFRDNVDTFTPTSTWTEREDAGSTLRTGAQFFLQEKLGGSGSANVAPSPTISSRYISVGFGLLQASTSNTYTKAGYGRESL